MHIVVAGGGTAGWISALLLASKDPSYKITVVESSKIGIIGVGESTTGIVTDIISGAFGDTKCNHSEFIQKTNATLKYGLKLERWTEKRNNYFWAPIDGTSTCHNTPDLLFTHGIKKYNNANLLKITEVGNLISNNATYFDIQKKQFNFLMHSLHVDAHLVGKYFKDKCMSFKNVNYIDSEIIDVHLNKKGFIKSLQLDNRTVSGDLFIDCTGFGRVLMKKMKNSWVSYRDFLPTNTAMPFLLKYKEEEYPLPYSLARAQSSGWMWQLPLRNRKGNGYVFDSNFITPDQAQREIEKSLGHKIEPVKIIKFDTGRYAKAWVNNCITIGLSYGFLEPLEATSIHSSVVEIRNLLQYLNHNTVNTGSAEIYNKRIGNMFDDFKDFISLHYTGGRTDTPFWKYVKNDLVRPDFVHNIIEMCASRLPTCEDFPSYPFSAGWPLWSFILAGLGHINKKNISIPSNQNSYLEQHLLDLQNLWKADTQPCMNYNQFIDFINSTALPSS